MLKSKNHDFSSKNAGNKQIKFKFTNLMNVASNGFLQKCLHILAGLSGQRKYGCILTLGAASGM